MPRHHVFAGERLTAFSDAVYAIVATIMVIPLKLTDQEVEKEKDFDLATYIVNRDFVGKVFIYMYAFILVLNTWYSHNRIFRLVEHVDDLITFLNLIVLLFVSLLPAAIVLVYDIASDSLVITIGCVVIILISASMCVMLFVAFRQREILDPRFTGNVASKYLKLTMYIPLLINPLLASLAILFAWVLEDTPQISQSFFFSIGLLNFLCRVIIWRLQKYFIQKNRNINSDLQDLLTKNPVSKERILAFSDGVFSIVATIIVLDITTIDIPESAKQSHGNVAAYIHKSGYLLGSYVSSFMVVGLLWFIHHSMFHFIEKITTRITFYNSISLMFVGLIPFGAGVVSKFVDEFSADSEVVADSENEVASVRVMNVLIILAGTSQLLLWTVAHFQKSKCLSQEINSCWMEFIQLWKLLIFPLWGLIVYFVTFASTLTVHHFYTYSTYAMPLLFILPRLLISILKKCQIRKKRSMSTVSEHYSRVQIQVTGSEEDHVFLPNEVTSRTFKDSTRSILTTGQTINEEVTII